MKSYLIGEGPVFGQGLKRPGLAYYTAEDDLELLLGKDDLDLYQLSYILTHYHVWFFLVLTL